MLTNNHAREWFRKTTHRIALVILLLVASKLSCAADLKLRLPLEIISTATSGTFRLDYHPPHGNPSPNFTFFPMDSVDFVPISDVLPGTEYAFHLYYTNSSVSDWKAWSSTVPTAPEPPTNLSASIQNGKLAEVSWNPPARGGHTGFKLSLVPLSEKDEVTSRNVYISQPPPFSLRDLTPGGSYDVQLYSVFQGQDSSVYTSTNFTTKPNTPGRFIVWFRNETTLLVLWQPPYPAGIFDHYRVSIVPEDAVKSVIYVEKDRDPPGPSQAAFNGLVPGRAYNISVQTVSHNRISEPTRAQYNTVPLSPTNVTYDKVSITSHSFDVHWSAPKSLSEFDRYQIALQMQNSIRQMVGKDEERRVTFKDGIQPGHTYEVVVKTVSGNVASWPVTLNVTTKPLPVVDLSTSLDTLGRILVEWQPNNESLQDVYQVKYTELESFSSGGSQQVVHENHVQLTSLLPGRNYSISVMALSKGIASDPVTIFQATKPSSPVIEILEPIEHGWNVSWKSDVTSRQDLYTVVYIRNDTKEKQEKTTKNNWIMLDNLYPGAEYEIKVYAISYSLWSEPHSYHQTLYPNPATNLQVVKSSTSLIILIWNAPTESLWDHFIVRYQTSGDPFWEKIDVANTTSCEIRDLIPGERYVLQVTSVSNKVESNKAANVEQTMYPNSIQKVKPVPDSHNITFEWKIPSGRLDSYIILYNAVSDPPNEKSQQVPVNDTVNKENMSVIISDLKPGELYSFSFFAVSYDLRSEGFRIRARTIPVIDSVINVVTNKNDTRTLGIKYTPTPKRNVDFDRYRFQLSDTSVLAQEKLQNDTNRLVIFDNLIPGRLYNISIWTVSGGVSSSPIYRLARLYPDPIAKVTVLTVTDIDITLSWEPPQGDKDHYEVEYQDHQGKLVRNITIDEQINYTGLRPHNNYTFLITVLSGYGTDTLLRSRPLSHTVQTLESVPGRVSFFRSIDVKPSQVILQWSLPTSEQNGILTGFKISYYIKGSSLQRQETFKAHEFQGTISNLIPGKTYIFEIVAHTKVGPGVKASWEETTPIDAPPQPTSNVFPTEIRHTTTTIRVAFKKNYFSNINGQVIGYTLIVTEDDSKESDALNLPNWRDVQIYSSWPPYQVTEPYYPFNGTLTEEFTIGSEQCKSTKRYCNGPLKPGSSYKVKIRAFTTQNKYRDTVYSYPIKTDPDNTTLIVGVLVPLSLLILLALILVVLRRRRVGPFTRKNSNKRGKDDTISIPESEIITNRPVKLKDFSEHYRIMSADSDFRFSEEFELLKHVGRDKPCSAADLPVNRPKNRFTNILPYDHSRVKLLPTDDEEGSDYINANYIPGFNSPREFIVSQGPLHSTRDDLWRMVWEQNCRAIVMLTRCIEKGREKCDHYWPFDTQPVYYGDIQVTILNESQYPYWTISEFKVCRGDQSRIVRHFHFTTWPDFGVPDPPQTLVKFVRAFRERVSPDLKPIVVHCSAGVGRSGTFIALDHLLQHIQKYDFVDIFGIVHEMRKERVWMVQNEQQYICIHQCLLCVLEKKEDVIDSPRPEAHDNQGYEDDEGIAESGI